VFSKQDSSNREARLRSLLERDSRSIARALRNAGVPESDLDDEVQRTFITAARRLDDVRVGSERRFLFQIAFNMALHTRRRLARRREELSGEVPERIETLATPEHLTNRKQLRERIEHIAGSMDKSIRTVFVLHEFEGLNVKEIAGFLGAARGTVASRLRRARDHFRGHMSAIELAGDLETKRTPGPRHRPRQQELSALENALRGAGRYVSAMASTRARTLSALGVTVSET
jgi:RNA polymerase sigma-70 factor (ECF subfamily)